MTSWKRQSRGDSGCQGLGDVDGWVNRQSTEDVLGQCNSMVVWWQILVLMHLSKPTECAKLRANPQVNYGLWVTCPCRFIDYNIMHHSGAEHKTALKIQVYYNNNNKRLVTRKGTIGGFWEPHSVYFWHLPPSRLWCLKNEVVLSSGAKAAAGEDKSHKATVGWSCRYLA